MPVCRERVKSIYFPEWSGFKTAVRAFASDKAEQCYDSITLENNLYFTEAGSLVFVARSLVIPEMSYLPNRHYQYDFNSNSGCMICSMDGLERAPEKFSVTV